LADSAYNTPADYISHHLTNNTYALSDHDLMILHLDSVVMAIIIGIFSIGLIWLVARKATSAVPTKTQAFVELIFSFIDSQVSAIFHGNRQTFVAPAALTVFLWVLMMNAMDFLPIDVMSKFYGFLGLHEWKHVPTSDVNTTFGLALGVWFLMIFFGIKAKGLGGWLHEFFCEPFGSKIWVWPANFLFNLIEYVSKPLSHSLRLFGNMYAGEVIFLLLGLWAATGVSGIFFSSILGAGWAIFHILIVVLQAYIFMMLTVVYLAMAQEGH
jgi:F-type H+-transporting ATPase subunit a